MFEMRKITHLSLMAEIKEMASLVNLKKALCNEGFDVVKISYLGELWVLLEFETAKAKDSFKGNVAWALGYFVIKQAYPSNNDIDESDVEEVLETLFDQPDDQKDKHSKDPFGLYPLLNKENIELARKVTEEDHSFVSIRRVSLRRKVIPWYRKDLVHLGSLILFEGKEDMERMISKEEVKRAVWDCGVDKSSGPDGFSFSFYRHFWPVIEKDVFEAVDYFFIKDYGDLTFEDGMVKNAASKLGCLVLKTPFTYLGTKVGGNMSRKQAWKEVVDKVLSSQLLDGRMKLLSSRGRLSPSYDSVRFFNGQDQKSNKAYWVKWNKVLTPKDKGGLGVSSLFALNRDYIQLKLGKGEQAVSGRQLNGVKFKITHIEEKREVERRDATYSLA
ncbi:hypothetical protein Tco_1483458 [Tanacetum coccineum]